MEASVAERLITRVATEAKVNFLLCARRRPRWISAREILYGDVFEVGRHALSMTHEEAAALLQEMDSSASGLIALAEGWPAVVGLAALQSTLPKATPAGDLPETLYEFLADELYQRLERPVRDALCQIALARTTSRDAAIDLLGSESGASPSILPFRATRCRSRP